jgi:hypothetical protein
VKVEKNSKEIETEIAENCLVYYIASVLALTEDSQITKMVRVCGHEDAGMHLAVS